MRNNFEENFPELAKEWDQAKNEGIILSDITTGSNKYVWWRCPKDAEHVYKQTVNKRTSVGVGCPYCAGKRITKERSLAYIDPRMASEWHPTKNENKTPETVFANSNKKFWWQCQTDPRHEWHTSPNSRRRRNLTRGCPFCANQAVDSTNSLASLYPRIAQEWHAEKNGIKKPDQFVAGSGEIIWWQCQREQSHIWQTPIRNRTAGSKCPYCSRQTSLPEIRIYTELQAVFDRVENRKKIDGVEADIFLPECNAVIEYDGGYWHYNREEKDIIKNNFFTKLGLKIIRVREQPLRKLNGYDILVSPEQVTKFDLDQIFEILKIYCAEKFQDRIQKYLKEENFLNEANYRKCISYLPSPFPENSISETHAELSKEWDYDANFPLVPSNFTAGSHKKVWWICKKNNSHKWEAAIKMRKAGRGCPYCSNHKPSKDNNLAVKYPELLKFWHPTKNVGLSPEMLSPKSNKKVWWICSQGPDHEWQNSPNQFFKHGKISGCPFCANKRISVTNNLAHLRPDLAREWCDERNGSLKPEHVVPTSGKSVWWRCSKDNEHMWKTRLAHRNSGSGCPFCSGHKKLTE